MDELGCLPLAIEQAAAYVREVTWSFTSYYAEYLKNRKKLSQWVPAGNRQYVCSVDTAWSMSFKVVRNNNPSAAQLLHLFSFLNPDGIQIDFLLDGAEALAEDLQQVLSSQSDMAKTAA